MSVPEIIWGVLGALIILGALGIVVFVLIHLAFAFGDYVVSLFIKDKSDGNGKNPYPKFSCSELTIYFINLYQNFHDWFNNKKHRRVSKVQNASKLFAGVIGQRKRKCDDTDVNTTKVNPMVFSSHAVNLSCANKGVNKKRGEPATAVAIL